MNTIRHVLLRDHSLVPAEAEVWVTVVSEAHTPTAEVRGRLMGPTCAYASTVEVAYHLRPLPPGRGGPLTARAVIPEASLWEPQSPFLYHGPVELWDGGRRCDQVCVAHGLRRLDLGARGLRVNGRPLALRGRALDDCTEGQARELRAAGYNLVVVPAGRAEVWEVADRVGLFVLARVGEPGRVRAGSASHASCLGWLVGPGEERPEGAFVGAELPAAGADFVVCPPERLGEARASGLPVLVLGAGGDREGLPVLGEVL